MEKCCTVKCRSKRHAVQLMAAVSKGTEVESLAYVVNACFNAGKVTDSNGRSLLHFAASVGKKGVVQWLLKRDPSIINTRDQESGYGALHRSLFYGQIHVAQFLIESGANLALLDYDGLTPLDHVNKDLLLKYSSRDPLEAYVWGSNANFNLGLGHQQQQRVIPEILEFFRKEGILPKTAALSKFHSAFLSVNGEAFTCGHGQGGRLGHGSEEPRLKPVKVAGNVTQISLGIDHTLFLYQNGTVASTGSNEYHQLGLSPPPVNVLSPTVIKGSFKGSIKGISASRFHSLVWTDEALYTWGLNAGQLGHIKGDRTIIAPRLVSCLQSIKIRFVISSSGAIVILTWNEDIVVLHEFRTKRIVTKIPGIIKVEALGGHLECGPESRGLVERGGHDLRVFILSKLGRIYVWEEGKNNVSLCTYNFNISVVNMALFSSGLFLVSEAGEAYEATYVKSSIKMKRLNGVHRAVSISCDPKGQNACALTVTPSNFITEVPEVDAPTLNSDLKAFFNSEEFDFIHDLIVVVGRKRYKVHRFILASSSAKMAEKLRNLPHGDEFVVEDLEEFKDNSELLFEQILQYAYFKSCDFMISGPINFHWKKVKVHGGGGGGGGSGGGGGEDHHLVIKENDDPKQVSAFQVYKNNKIKTKIKNKTTTTCDENNPIEALIEASKNLGFIGLSKAMKNFKYSQRIISEIKRFNPITSAFSRRNFQGMNDVNILTEDKMEIGAHKVILAARSDYFRSMLCFGWSESGRSDLKIEVPSKIMNVVLDYLYTDNAPSVTSCSDVEFICNVLVTADQFLMTRLIQICERQIANLMTLKNVGEIFKFAFDYQVGQLKATAMQFICQNLTAVLESRALEVVTEESYLVELSRYYQGSEVFCRRRITPYEGVTSEELETFYEQNYEGMSVEEIIDKTLSSVETPKKISKRKSRKSSTGSNDSEDEAVNKKLEDLSLDDFEKKEEDEKNVSNIVSQNGNEEERRKEFMDNLMSRCEEDKQKILKKSPKKKLSQKERKRLNSETTPPAVVIPESPSSPVTIPWKGWSEEKSPEAEISERSFTDIMRTQSSSGELSSPPPPPPPVSTKSKPKAKGKKIWKQLSLAEEEAEIEKIKAESINPWKKLPEVPVTTETFSSKEKECFKEILRKEAKKEEKLIRAISKPLSTTQLEEKAIEELKKFYNADNIFDEHITVVRVTDYKSFAVPVWKKKK